MKISKKNLDDILVKIDKRLQIINSSQPLEVNISKKKAYFAKFNEEDSSNVLLMHAMGPNVSGVVGSAVAAGVLISIFA